MIISTKQVWEICCLATESHATLLQPPLSVWFPRQEKRNYWMVAVHSITGMVAVLLQGLFLTQRLDLCLLLGRWILDYWATWEAQFDIWQALKAYLLYFQFSVCVCTPVFKQDVSLSIGTRMKFIIHFILLCIFTFFFITKYNLFL